MTNEPKSNLAEMEKLFAGTEKTEVKEAKKIEEPKVETKPLVTEEEVEVSPLPKKRGRPAKPKIEETTPSEPKKRGRKPKVVVEGEVKEEKAPKVDKYDNKDAFVSYLLKRNKLDKIPELKDLTKHLQGKPTKIKDIGVFIGTTKEPILKDLYKTWGVQNISNISTEVSLKRIEDVAEEIFLAGKMYKSIFVSKQAGSFDCWDGRHRVALLALLYGLETTIPVIETTLSLQESRDAAAFANSSRKILPKEKSELAVLKATNGCWEEQVDELYKKVVKSKSDVKDYCVARVISQKWHGVRFDFDVSTEVSKGESLTTVNAVKSYWGSALTWEKGIERDVFDKQVKSSVKFLNDVVAAFQGVKNFNPKEHFSGKTIVAIGSFFNHYHKEDEEKPFKFVDHVAKEIVKLGDIGDQKSSRTLKALFDGLKK